MATQATLFIDQGCTYRAVLSLTVPPAAGEPAPDPPTPFNLTGCTAALTISSGYGATPWISLTSASGGGLTLGGTAGTITIVITATQTAAIPMPPLANPQQVPVARGVFDLVLTLESGDIVRYLQGAVQVIGGVTMPGGAGEPQ